MNKVFIYATLKKRGILEEALGEKHGKELQPAVLHGYQEKPVHYDQQSWPTLWAMGPKAETPGDIIEVDDEELGKLKSWENHYKLRPVSTSVGDASAFFFERPGVRASLGQLATWREG